jgi:hypothetical protein
MVRHQWPRATCLSPIVAYCQENHDIIVVGVGRSFAECAFLGHRHFVTLQIKQLFRTPLDPDKIDCSYHHVNRGMTLNWAIFGK